MPVRPAAFPFHAHRLRRAIGIVAAFSAALQAGCYSYVTPPMGEIPSGGDVQVELTSDGTVAMQPALGPRIHLIEGRVQQVDADGSALISVESVTSREGVTLPYAGREAVRVPRAAVLKTDLRTLDRRRTWWTAGLIAGTFAVVVITALEKARSRNSGSAGRISASAPEFRAP